jgi:hypothetical protein
MGTGKLVEDTVVRRLLAVLTGGPDGQVRPTV